MKNTFAITLIGLLMPLLAAAQRISDDEAKKIASQVLGRQAQKVGIEKPAKAPSLKDEDQHAPFYSIYTGEDGQGFVIVSTDRRAPKVIGYGEGKADPNSLPPQLKAILAKQDSVLQANSSMPEHKSWSAKAPRLAKAKASGKVLKTANWGQDYPYNMFTPEIDGQHCPTGCVATAMAIILKYYGWPEKGYGEFKYLWNNPYSGSQEEIGFDYESNPFNWSDMPLDYVEGKYTEAQAENVAKLMKATGISVRTEYSPWESGAGMYAFSFYKRFRFELPSAFDKEGSDIYPSYDDDDFESMIRKEISENRVVLYGAGKEDSRHAFVIDGYGDEGIVHINWGWDGQLNGYYDFPYCSGYDFGAYLMCNLEPDESAATEVRKLFVNDGAQSGFNITEVPGITLNILGENLVKDKEYRYYSASIAALETMTAQLALALTDKDGNVKEIVSKIDNYKANVDASIFYNWFHDQPFSRNGMYGTFTITTDIAATDYVQMVYRKDAADNWKTIKAPKYAPARCPVVGNKPVYFDVNIDCPDEVRLEVSDLIRHDIKSKKFKAPAFCTVVLVAKSAVGIPVIFCNNERGACTYIDGNTGELYVNSGYGARRDFKFKVELTKYSEMTEMVIDVKEPETLDQLISLEDAKKVSKLKLTGMLGMNDMNYLYNFLSLIELDLSDATLATGGLPPCQLNCLGAMQKLVLPKNLLGIDQIALTAVRYIDLPKSIEYIGWKEMGYQGFTACSELSEVMVHWEEPLPMDEELHHFHDSFVCNEGNMKLYVPKGTKEKYANAPVWKRFDHIIEFDEDDYQLEKPNEITWEQDLDIVRLPTDIVYLTATSTSGERVRYRVIEGEKNGNDYNIVLYPQYGNFIGYRPASVVIEAFQFPSLLYGAPEPVRKTVTFVEPVMLDKREMVMQVGETSEPLKVICYDYSPDEYHFTWHSYNTDAVEIDELSGIITAVGYGKARIQAFVYRNSDDEWIGLGECEVLVSKPGDANGDGGYTVNDVALVVDHIMDYINEDDEFYEFFADIDGDGEILIPDLTATIDLVLSDPVNSSTPAFAPMMAGESRKSLFNIEDTESDSNGLATMDVSIRGGFFATQFDLVLPTGTHLEKAELNGRNAESHNIRYEYIDDNRVRIVVYSMDNSEFPETNLLSLTLQCESDKSSEILLTRALADESELFGRKSEKASADACARIISNNTTGITIATPSKEDVRHATSLSGIVYTVKGKDDLKQLPAGIYLVNNKKIIIR